jgi:hypothetical protein
LDYPPSRIASQHQDVAIVGGGCPTLSTIKKMDILGYIMYPIHSYSIFIKVTRIFNGYCT